MAENGEILVAVVEALGEVSEAGAIITTAHFGVSIAYWRQEPGLTKQVSGVGAGVRSRTMSCDLRSGTK